MEPLYSDEYLIKGLREQDDTVSNFLYNKYYMVIIEYITSNSGSKNTAEDIVQDAFIKLYTEVRKSDFVLLCSFDAYFTSIYKNTWRKYTSCKNRNVLTDRFPEVIDENTDESLFYEKRKFLQKIILDHFKLLNKGCQKTLEMFYFEKAEMTEIAIELGFKNAHSAKKKKYKCMLYLKSLIEKHKLYKNIYNNE